MARVLFVQDAWYEKIGVMTISSVLKANGHSCQVLIAEGDDPELINSIRRYEPDIIALSLLTTEMKFGRKLAEALKRDDLQAFVVAGGPHATFFPEFIHTEGIDAINIAEGELAMLELANAMDGDGRVETIPNLLVKDNGTIRRNPLRSMVDLEELPLIDWEIYLEHAHFHTKEAHDFVVSMGCPYNCSYCFFHQWNELYKGTPGVKTVRLKSVDRCMREVQSLASRIDVQLVNYVDSTFNINKSWVLEFLKAYKSEFSIPFSFNLRANLVDEEIVKAVADTKLCRMVRMGIETGSEELRTGLLRKKVTNAQIYRAADLLHKHGIRLITYNMYCLPGETFDQACETIEMNQRLRPFAISSMIFHPYKGLEITKYALEKGYLREADIGKLEERKYKWFRSVLRQDNLQDVQNLCLLSRLAIWYPFTFPIVKRLARLPTNGLFDASGMIGLLHMGMRWFDKGPWPLIKEHIISDKSKLV